LLTNVKKSLIIEIAMINANPVYFSTNYLVFSIYLLREKRDDQRPFRHDYPEMAL